MQSRPITRAFLVVFVSLLTLLVRAIPAGAQTAPTTSYTFTVTTTNDTHDAKPGDGVCADSNGQCSLRAATEEADALPAGSKITITVPAGTYGLTLGSLQLTANTITIYGAGSTTTIIKGNNTFGIMVVTTSTHAYLSQLTIEGGSAPNSPGGGGINNSGMLTVTHSTISNNTASYSGGGINNSGMLTVTHSTISNNTASYNGTGGGGISNFGTLTVAHSTFSGNSSDGNEGGGILNGGTATVSHSTFSANSATYAGGGISNNGTLTVAHSTFSGNSAISGGGISNYGTLTVSHSTLSGNTGGIDNEDGSLSVSNSTISNNNSSGGILNNEGPLNVSNSTLSGNSAYYGGGIYNYNGGTVSVSNSTFSGNSASNEGGGIYNGNYNYGGGPVSVSHSTFSGNSAGNGGGIGNDGSSTITLTATIVANNPTGGNCAGPILEGAGYNLDSGKTCGFTNHSLNNTNPKLGPLGNNGGPTQTMALLQGSKAIDWVALNSCPAGLAVVTDQRGDPRPDGSGESTCDIGAYESAY